MLRYVLENFLGLEPQKSKKKYLILLTLKIYRDT